MGLLHNVCLYAESGVRCKILHFATRPFSLYGMLRAANRRPSDTSCPYAQEITKNHMIIRLTFGTGVIYWISTIK